MTVQGTAEVKPTIGIVGVVRRRDPIRGTQHTRIAPKTAVASAARVLEGNPEDGGMWRTKVCDEERRWTLDFGRLLRRLAMLWTL